jgi:formate hydrogenlyase subunit 6/NADH:ubiquinone oxidoreductase subunit I
MVPLSLRSLIYLLPQVWRAVIRGPRTVRYPFAPAELPPGYRGRVVMADPDRCRGCGLCARDCPAFALELEREDRRHYRLIYHPDRCAYCGQCEVSCVHGAIACENDFVPGTPDRETLTTVLVERDD